MKKNLHIFLTLLIISVFSQPSFSQVKVGFISPDDVFTTMPEVKAAEATLAAYQQEKQNEYNAAEDKVNELYDKFTKDSATLSPAVKEAHRKELQDKIAELTRIKQIISDDLEQKKFSLQNPIHEKLMKAIRDVARENGFAYVLTSYSALVIPDASDITKLVRKKLGLP